MSPKHLGKKLDTDVCSCKAVGEPEGPLASQSVSNMELEVILMQWGRSNRGRHLMFCFGLCKGM